MTHRGTSTWDTNIFVQAVSGMLAGTLSWLILRQPGPCWQIRQPE